MLIYTKLNKYNDINFHLKLKIIVNRIQVLRKNCFKS